MATPLDPRATHLPANEAAGQRRRDRGALWALVWLGLVATMGLLAGVLASSLPFYAKVNGQAHYPWLTPRAKIYLYAQRNAPQYYEIPAEVANWPEQNLEAAWWPLVPYGPEVSSPDRRKLAPLHPYARAERGVAQERPWRFTHWLGTDGNGHDLLAGLIHGARHSLWPALLGALLAWGLGLGIGGLSGYAQGRRWYLPLGRVLMGGLGLLAAWFWGWESRIPLLRDAGEGQWEAVGISWLITAALLGLSDGLGRWLSRWLDKPIRLPIDGGISRVIEVIDGLPGLLLIMTLLLLFEPKNRWELMLCIGAVGWMGVARLVRVEVMRLQRQPYIEAAHAAGLPHWRILVRHVGPNVIAPMLVLLVISVGGFLLVESTLSFLNLFPAPVQRPSWGSLLGQALQPGNHQAWWLAVMPGSMIFLTVLSLNALAEWMQDYLDPRKSVRLPWRIWSTSQPR